MEFTKEQKVYAEIVQRAWEDAEFKKELIANPVDAIEKMTGETLNLQGKTLVVKDQTDESVVHINIPAKATADAELNEEQLEAVSGGVWDPTGTGGGCTDPVFTNSKSWSSPPFLSTLS